MPSAPVAVLDANVLFPFQLRNLLLHLAVDGLFQPLWSERNVDECVRNPRLRTSLTEAQCAHLVGADARGVSRGVGDGIRGCGGWAALAGRGRPPRDRAGGAPGGGVHHHPQPRHFPADVLRPLRIRPLDPDRFIVRLWRRNGPAVVRAADRHRLSLRRAPLAPERYLESLRTHAGLPRTVRRLAAAGFAATTLA